MKPAKALLHSLWLGAALLGWACHPTEADQSLRPDNLLSTDEMATILTEVHIAESRVNKMGLMSSDSSTLVYKQLEKQIYHKLKVDTAAYRKSYIYYAANPAKLEVIYKEVVKKLDQKLTPTQSLTAPQNQTRS